MSSPAPRRSTRSSQAGTPSRTTRNSQPRSSPAPAGPSNTDREDSSQAGGATPRQTRTSALASSPLFFPSSPANEGANNPQVSSPLRHLSNSQSTASQSQNRGAPSSPLRQDTDTQSTGDGDRTPVASGLIGVSSPIRYDPSSSPARNAAHQQSNLRSERSGLFVGSQRSSTARSSRIDSNAEAFRKLASRQVFLNEAGQVVRDGSQLPSEASSFARARNNNTTSEADALGGAGQGFIWGTAISVEDTAYTFKNFLNNFTKKYRMWADGATEADTRDNPDAESTPYREAMDIMLELGQDKLYVDLRDLKAFPPTEKLYHQIILYPVEILVVMDQTVKDCMLALAQQAMSSQRASTHGAAASQSRQPPPSSEPAFPSSERSEEPATPSAERKQEITLEDQVHGTQYTTRPFGLEKTTNLRHLNPSDLDTLVSVKGLVIRATPVIPDMHEAFFKCSVCGHSIINGLDRGKIREPTECPRGRCASKNSMQLIHNRCSFKDKQVIKLQETPEMIPAGQTPHSVSVVVHGDLVDFCKAGDRVELTGIFKVNSVRVNPAKRVVKSVHKTFLDTVHVQKVDSRRLGVDPSILDLADAEDAHVTYPGKEETRKISPEDEEKIRETAARPDIYELLARSLAPSVYEMDDVKKGILLQLFGGTNKTFQKGGGPRYRGDINVLLCGDPSTAKSQILSYVHRIAPRGVYTSGKGSSAVGLTAYVTRDPESRQLVLESGALVLSDGGVCCIDEFDKMNESTRSVLHEVMEQQTVSVAKAGIITTLNARTSILASANPIGSRYNPDLPVPQNIDLPPTLLSRFDLVYLILDRADEKTDRRLARHLLSMYLEDKPQSAQTNNDILPVEFLTSYISYARANIFPTITQAAADELINAYVDMRKLGQDVRAAEQRITATTRQLESMIRLAEAHAKMRLASEVTTEDVREAVRLIRSALKTAATDAQGRIDMSLLTEGTSAADRHRRQDMKDAVVRLLDEITAGGQTVRFSDVMKRLGEGAGVPVEPAEFAEVMRSLEMEGKIMVGGEGARKSVRRVTAVV